MPKINVVNGNIEDAIKKLKRQNARNGLDYYKNYVKENAMKSLALKEKRSQRLLEKENIKNKMLGLTKVPTFFTFI